MNAPRETQRPAPTEAARLRRALSAHRPRNDSLVDAWSFVHLTACAALTLVLGPLVAFVVALAWEPLEVKVLSPLFAKVGVDFGHEGWKNSLMDLAFNAAGVLLAALLVLPRWNPLGV